MTWFGWVADNAGCAWYRAAVPLTGLQRTGLVDEVKWSMGSNGKELVEAEVLMAQRTVNEEANPLLWRLAAEGYPYVYDLDDLLWAIDPSNKIAHRYYAQDWVQQYLMRTIDMAELVTVSTPELRDEVLELGLGTGRVDVLPNCVPSVPGEARSPEAWPVTPDGERVRPLRVLWAGSRTHDGDLQIVRYATKRLAEQGKIELWLMGVEYRDILPWAKGVVPWAENSQYLETLAGLGMDVMLAPVKPSRFNHCKSHLKALDAMAAGLIPLASDGPTYNRLVRHGENGLLAKWREQDWYEKLRWLAEAPWDELVRLQTAGLETANEYLIDRHAQSWYDSWGSVRRTPRPDADEPHSS